MALMIALGPYRFSEADAAHTLSHGELLFDLVTEGLGPDARHAVAPMRSTAEQAWTAAGGSSPADPDALARFWHAWRSAMQAVRATGRFGPSAIGTATGLFTSDGGVPKVPRPALEVDHGGAVGDRQANRTHHGRPWQALCLWSSEVVEAFRAAGHPIAPGLAGENVSVTGLAWSRVRPGVQLRIGDVLAEVSSYATPCAKNAPWFTDGVVGLMAHRQGPVSRVYATVLEPGTVGRGDPVLLEPDA